MRSCYEAAAKFGQLRDGTVAVKGGWRIYSSGPGLYLHKVVTGLLGWRESFGEVIIDTVLPRNLDGLTVRFNRGDKVVTARYKVSSESPTPKAVIINGKPLTSFRLLQTPYRSGGMAISAEAFEAALDRAHNRIEIEL